MFDEVESACGYEIVHIEAREAVDLRDNVSSVGLWHRESKSCCSRSAGGFESVA